MPGRINQGLNWIQTVLWDGATIAADAMTVGLLAATQWAAGTVYAAGTIVYQGSRGGTNDNVYVCTTGGTSAGSGGPTGTGTGITDNTVTWAHIKSATLAQITAGSAEPSGGSYARKTIAATATTISAAGVMTHTAVQWGTGVTSISAVELWLLVAETNKAYAWGWLSAQRTLTTADTLTEAITDTAS